MVLGRDEDPTFFSLDPDPAQLREKNPDPAPDPTLNRNEEIQYIDILGR